MTPDFIYPRWPAPDNVVALTTTRAGGHSKSPFDGFNVAQHVNDDPNAVDSNRAILRQHLPTEPVWLNQTHSKNIELLKPRQTVCGEIDGAITFAPNVVCTIMTADCLPVLLTNRQGTFVAAVHAGWRGLASGIISECLKHIPQNDRASVLAWLGPAIGPEAFEVGDEVKNVFVDLSKDNALAFKPFGKKWLCDIYQLATNELNVLGVHNIYGGDHCTYTEQEKFYSYRRDGTTGRMASCIYLK